ncbi:MULTISPECIES: DUF4184 family protein [unclassified Psychrobacter]|uniref:DUF4184 family protein n=1 Tax=unclassified Psychrobacter TaxID=196806 RepID=UPI00071E79A2|nr:MULTISPECIES: DUF4184 family protein [unclassified Psychrobacter]OLF36420.1 hypothetical protein BTV98_10865 [Psychrobacter sp. Cmf 22.2]
MAFTLAHMAAALPFYRNKKKNRSIRCFHFEALLIGTMMPDFPYYIGASSATGNLSHQWMGVFTYCLPWGLTIFALWNWGLKPAAFALVQPFLIKRAAKSFNLKDVDSKNSRNKVKRYFTGYANRYWSFAGIKKRVLHKVKSFYLPVVLSLVFGAFTHLIWDGITHADGSIARHIDWLQYPLYFFPFKGTSIARLLQYLSSIVGLGALFWFALLRAKDWQINTKDVAEETETDTIVTLMFSKKQSVIIIVSMTTLCLVWGIQAVLNWYPSLTSSPYRFAAGVSVSLLKRVTLLCVSYTALYHLTYFLQNTYRQYKK